MNDFEGCTYPPSAHLSSGLGFLEITSYGAFTRVRYWNDEVEEYVKWHVFTVTIFYGTGIRRYHKISSS